MNSSHADEVMRGFMSGLLGGGLLAGFFRLDPEKNVGMHDLDVRWDSAANPVADALRSACCVKAEQLGNSRRAAKGFDNVNVVHG